MKLKYILLTVLVALTCVLGGCGNTQTQPATQPVTQPESQPVTQPEVQVEAQPEEPADPVLLCYKEILSAAPALESFPEELQDASFDDVVNHEMFGNHYDQFMLVDLDRDGSPELIASTIINFRWIPISVFTYANGQAVLLKDPMGESVNGTFEQMSVANGAYDTYICADNHIHSVWSGMTPVGEMEENSAYELVGTSLNVVNCAASEGTSFFDASKPNIAQNRDALCK